MRVRALLIACVIAAASTLIAPPGQLPVARADVPDSVWTIPLAHDSQLVANPSGGVLASVGNSSTASQPDVQQVMADGSLGWTRDHRTAAL
jgi:hypothetical protein